MNYIPGNVNGLKRNRAHRLVSSQQFRCAPPASSLNPSSHILLIKIFAQGHAILIHHPSNVIISTRLLVTHELLLPFLSHYDLKAGGQNDESYQATGSKPQLPQSLHLFPLVAPAVPRYAGMKLVHRFCLSFSRTVLSIVSGVAARTAEDRVTCLRYWDRGILDLRAQMSSLFFR
ncbi:hypothetical protein B484DRAFT_448054 [Ochromonadaceae sp. CCMP2298]|nr:hypothetical protein B484DRAFT_448054 [Ochromonadaceae sp. CCMP2298]